MAPKPSSSSMGTGTIMLSGEPSFDMLVLGCGGGPAENDLSAYWVKPAGQAWSEGFVSVDGGSCLGAVVRLLDSHPDTFRDFLDQPPATSTQQASQTMSSSTQALLQQRSADLAASTLLKAGLIYDMLRAFLITHAHWDHISGLVLSSSSGSSKQKTVYGSKQTISNLSSAMNGGLWPILGSYEAANGVPYVWQDMAFGQERSVQPVKGLSASIMPLCHGKHHQNTPYESSTFFIENDATNQSLLIFGDIEPDSVSGFSLNRKVWTEAAKRISEGRLSAMLIECSYCSSRPKEQLYGHLSPVYIAEELQVLASLLPPQEGQDPANLTGRLSGVTVCIVHVKDPISIAEVLDPAQSSVPATQQAAEDESVAPASKRSKTSPSSSTPSSPSRRTRSTLSRSAVVPLSPQHKREPGKKANTNTSLPEGIKMKIYNELQELEGRDQFGVRYLMLEQGMRIAF